VLGLRGKGLSFTRKTGFVFLAVIISAAGADGIFSCLGPSWAAAIAECVVVIAAAILVIGWVKFWHAAETLSKTAGSDAIEIIARAQSQAGQSQKAVESLKIQAQSLQAQIQIAQRRRHNTEEIIYSIRDAVIVTDSNENVLLANEAAASLFGFEKPAGTPKAITELIKHDEFIKIIKQARQSRTRHIRHEINIDCDGAPKTLGCTISTIIEDDGQVSGVVAVLHDITREKEISQLKNEFVSHVSHELKTPLASITAYAEMLVDGEANDDETRAEFYHIIQTQAQRLNRLIEDILNISRIESGLIKVKKECASMTILIRDAVQMIKSYAAEKNIQVHEQEPIVFDQVYVDKDMISQVIINLLSNAVKYTPSGGQIRVESGVDEADGKVRVSVIDTGVGIPESEVDRVFDKFYRVEANNKCAKGTGLGLNLVKQIVEKVHDGRVYVSSRQGQGSTFGFELPLGAREPATV
jgi:two-component system phosphate regulon sensor histidine kinase PhoR